MKNSFAPSLVLFLCLFYNITHAQNNHEIVLRQNLKILNSSSDTRELMKASRVIANEYQLWQKPAEAIKYYKMSVEYADAINQYNHQYDLRLFMAKQYEKVNNLSEAINVLNTAFEISVKNKKEDDANRVLALLEGYYRQIGKDQEALKKKKDQLLAKLSEKVEESKNIQNDNNPSNRIELSEKLNEVAQLQTQLQKTEVEYNSVKDLLAQTQSSVTEKNTIIQQIRLEIIEKDSIIKIKNLVIIFSIIIIIAIFTILIIVIRKNKIEKRQKKELEKQNKRIEEQSIALKKQNKEIEEKSIALKKQNEEIEEKSDVLKLQNTEIEKQSRELQRKNAEIEEKSHELITQNEELQSTLEYLRKAQRQLIQKEQMASLGRLMAGIAHEINTPLGAINSSIDTVLIASEKNRTYLRQLVKNISDEHFQILMEMLDEGIKNFNHFTSREERAIRNDLKARLQEYGIENSHKLADSLTDIGIHEIKENYLPLFKSEHIDLIMQTAYNANIQFKNGFIIRDAVKKASKIMFALKFYSFTNNNEEMILSDITQSIDSVLTLYHNQLKHKIKIEKDFEKLPQILCYPDQLSQIWTNLINNSIHAIKGSGNITIKAKLVDKFIQITITDDGVGIPESIRDKIFDPFFTTKSAGEGTGLGLDIIKKIIDTHEGEISFDTVEGQGTTFTILLPIDGSNK